MKYPVYYKLNFDSFKNYVNFMRLTAHEIVDKASLSMRELASMKEIVVNEVVEYNERIQYNECRQVLLARFGIQYVAYFNRKGEKLIWLNGFDKDSPFFRIEDKFYFESKVIEVEDGGNGYFETTINLTAGKASGIQIHGSA